MKGKLPFLEENQMEQKLPVRNFQKFGFSKQSRLLFQNFLEMLCVNSMCHLKGPRIEANISGWMENAHYYFYLDEKLHGLLCTSTCHG